MVDHRSIQRFYDRWAGPYDLLAAAPLVRKWRRRAVETLDLQAGDVVVEMGCGTGVNIPILRERVGPAGQVIGIDLSPGMLARARQRSRREGWQNVHLVRADAGNPPIAGSVQAVFGSFVVGMFSDPAAVVERWMALLVPGGQIALLDAVPSDSAVARPLNLVFRALTRLTAPSSRTVRESPAATLSHRVRAAHGRLDVRTEHTVSETAGLGYVRLKGGEVS